tara:strand:+ start:76 stop:1284 length:1209 start_codon:yes stop_codon:yes gene_type:complete
MRSTFAGYFRPKDQQLEELWGKCIFAVDANVLLNLYRYSTAAKSELETALKAVSDRVYIPHQAAKEFLKNRLSVTAGQANEYTKAISTIQGLLETLSSKDRHPFLPEDQLPDFRSYSDNLVKSLESQQKALLGKFDDDEILAFIEGLFEGKTGKPYSNDELEALAKDGEIRYTKEIPPGYKDGKKDGSNDLYRKYGDLIVWKQLIDYSSIEKNPIIFITDDRKEDWWLQQSGRTIGPRPELIEEFNKETSQELWMYSVDRFIQESAKIAKTTVSDEVMKEIVKVSLESKLADDSRQPSITVIQDSAEASKDLNCGLLIVTLNNDMRYATGTGKFYPYFSSVPDFDVDLISSPSDDNENIAISFGCGTVKNFNVHLKAKDGELAAGDYIFQYVATTKSEAGSA